MTTLLTAALIVLAVAASVALMLAAGLALFWVHRHGYDRGYADCRAGKPHGG